LLCITYVKFLILFLFLASYILPQAGVILPPCRVTLHYRHLPLNQSLCDVTWSMSKNIYYAATADCDHYRHGVVLHSHTSVVVRAPPGSAPHLHLHPLTPSCLVNFDHEPEPTDIKVQSFAMKEGDASLTFTGQGVLSRLAGCILGCQIPRLIGKHRVECTRFPYAFFGISRASGAVRVTQLRSG
jgi:hypothetical protein